MMSMDPRTGYVKAYVGGINYKNFQYDHVIKENARLAQHLNRLHVLAIQMASPM